MCHKKTFECTCFNNKERKKERMKEWMKEWEGEKRREEKKREEKRREKKGKESKQEGSFCKDGGCCKFLSFYAPSTTYY